MKFFLSACLLFLWSLATGSAQAEPAQVTVGTYINKIQDLNFRENKYALDFFIWFRWKAEGELADFKPLESFEIINGSIEGKSSVVEKKIGDVSYASARISATMADSWDLRHFPFDRHRNEVRIEDSAFTAESLQFVADAANSALGEEIDMAGWVASGFKAAVATQMYRTNYGDTTLPTDSQSQYSRFVAGWDLERVGWGSAVKLLLTVFLATAVAFVSFMVRASDLDARFGMGVGGLFAVMASTFVVAGTVPDSGSITLAEEVHIVALGFIFLTLLISALCLRLEAKGQEERAATIDYISLVLLPLGFFGWSAWAISAALRS